MASDQQFAGPALLAKLPNGGRLKFVKMSGSGNDFVMLDNRGLACAPDTEVLSALARTLCRRGVAVGADGLVAIEDAPPNSEYAFSWRYFNNDGSEGDLCGNGAMCGARFAVLNGAAPPGEFCFKTRAGKVIARVEDAQASPTVSMDMPEPTPVCPLQPVTAPTGQSPLDFVTVGVPHAVVFVPDADAFGKQSTFCTFGRTLRHNTALFPQGANVNVVSLTKVTLPGETEPQPAIRMRTYERGVEDETLACGTGACSTALAAYSRGLVTSFPINIIVSSYRILRVSFEWDAKNMCGTKLTLAGEARVITEGYLNPDVFL